ncbi:serine protease 1-like [Drosophila nasuta]|uniref:serine protease 1-like n=1 Tax=Drosophila nasuta TaxID=42062 RepID=UPI00295EE44F|nr:serine protease 1-like [Drosophila nasuta]
MVARPDSGAAEKEAAANICMRPHVFGNKTQVLKPKLVRLMSQQAKSFLDFSTGFEDTSERSPYIVTLEFSGKNTTWFCVGSIIDHEWIVTVASCTNPSSSVKISYGAANRLEPSYHVSVSNASFYPRFDFNKWYHHDIVLIKVPFITYSKKVKAVALPKTRSMFRDVWAYSAGWGQHKDNKELMQILHSTQIQIIGNKDCIKSGYGERFKSGMMCAQLPNMEKSCRLDSGSPLVMLKPTVLLGIASFGNQLGCESNTPLVYTRINSYTQWMAEVMAEEGSRK